MSEETTAPDEIQDTPTTAAPEDTGHAAEGTIDYAGRYNDLRSEFDRRNDLLSRAKQGDAEALSELGFELYDDTEDTPAQADEFDPFDHEYLQQYIAQQVQQGVEQALTPFQQQQQQQEVEIASATRLHAIPGFEDYAPEDQDTIWELAKALPPQPDGTYDVEGAFERLTGVVDRRLSKYADGKKRAPKVTPGGQAATEVPDLDDEAARQRYMAERLADLGN